MSEILQELQKVRDEASATKEQLSSYRESSNKLQQELKVCNITLINTLLLLHERELQLSHVLLFKAKEVAMANLQEDLQRVRN